MPRFRDATSLLAALNRDRADPYLEEHLASLRCRAAAEVTRSGSPSPPTTIAIDDPFPDLRDDVPEVAPKELSAELLRGAIEHHGSLLVRGLIEPRVVNALAAATVYAFDAREQARTATPPWYVPCRRWDDLSGGKSHLVRPIARMCSGIQLVDAPRALAQAADAFEAVGLPDLIAGYLDEPVLWSVDRTTLRHASCEVMISWHQDGAVNTTSRGVTVWVALSECGPGTGAAGIAIVPRRVDALLAAGGGGAPLPTALSDADVERAGGGITVAPIFGPGDALIFDDRAVHTTDGTTPDWTRHRYALVAWAFASSTFPQDCVPFVM